MGGQISIGQNMLIAFMAWSGANYEDAIIVSERIVKDSKFTTIHIEEFVVNVRDTKLGPEVTTHDIPNVGSFFKNPIVSSDIAVKIKEEFPNVKLFMHP